MKSGHPHQMIKILQSKLFLLAVVFVSTLFIPWRIIYKGARPFIVLPLWWEYGNPQNNFLVIVGHIIISLMSGVLIALFVSKCVKQYKSDDESST
jgi:hypothetical protein